MIAYGRQKTFIHSFIYFILPSTRNTTTVYRNTLKIIYDIPTKLFTRSNVIKTRKPIQKPEAYKPYKLRELNEKKGKRICQISGLKGSRSQII